ncbi:unnamed protein product [Ceratitis capitata]|uniref:(Mediterranean fruit fly) hypothetical protein n=1 Tax=Ceratitis capitata TaxID=7213 RepID=W8BVL8_CERCA|nr:unnamed protein product [Ceratitis capitata]
MSRLNYQPISDKRSHKRKNLISIGIANPIQIITTCAIILLIRILYSLDARNFYDTSNDISTIYYFLLTSECRTPYVDPFSTAAFKLFNPGKLTYENCANDIPLIQSVYLNQARKYVLHMNMSAMAGISNVSNTNIENIHCCYREIRRPVGVVTNEDRYIISPCVNFPQDFMVPQHIDFMITECYLNNNKTSLIQKDAFSFVQQKNNTNNNDNAPKSNSTFGRRKPNILLLGIDSVSRINIRRTMPQTFKYMQMNNWFELQGYNKIADNTFPNLMALLSSYNLSTAEDKCRAETVGGLNRPECNFIWNKFKENGYKTAYAEDSIGLSTFNYGRKGFLQQPTDYYIRPMLLAISSKMAKKRLRGGVTCIGRKHQAEYIYDFALQFANSITTEPFFGLFWTNSFSHEYFDLPLTMDVKILEYLKHMKSNGILDSSIVIFFSDHGMRWGPLLQLNSGFFEERLPMMFISIPAWFQYEYPEFVKSLKLNRYRLTSPYDIYATMGHVIELGNPQKQFLYANDTIKGLSIFREIPENRTCYDAEIPEHWCACSPYETISSSDSTARSIVFMVIDEINRYLFGKNISDKCSQLFLDKLKEVQSKIYNPPNQTTYRLTFDAKPKRASFQATAIYYKISNTIKTVVEDISRLDSYVPTSGCLKLKEARKYCICKDKDGIK